MSFGVRQWPDSPDPRGSLFSYAGWNWGQVAPWAFIVSSIGATGIYAYLNAGVAINAKFDDGFNTTWSHGGAPPDFPLTQIFKVGTEAPVGPAFDSISLTVLINPTATDPMAIGQLDLSFPNAITAYAGIPMSDGGGPVAAIPNGVTITPARWDVPVL